MRTPLLLTLVVLLHSCTSHLYITDQSSNKKFQLPAQEKPAMVQSSVIGLGNYLILSEDEFLTPSKNKLMLAQRAAQMGASHVYIMEFDSNYYYVPNSYNQEVRKMYEYTSLFLIHPDSLKLEDRVMQVEIYDEGDSTLMATGFFDHKEQLTKIIGDKTTFNSWFQKQPLFFMRQHNNKWKYFLNEPQNRLIRLHSTTNTEYVIIPETVDEFKVKLKTPTRHLLLITKYYGQHDWTIGSLHNQTAYFVEYKLDQLARVTHMKVSESVPNTVSYATHGNAREIASLKYRVHIYYRPTIEDWPSDWTVRNYFNSKPRL
jgi:hypothetical protein